MPANAERDSVASLAHSGAWLLTSHLISMGIGLLGLPVLMVALGTFQFGAWAVLLGGTFAFGTLELGMSSAVMRWATLAMMPGTDSTEGTGISAIISNSLVCTLLVFGIAGIPVLLFAEPLAAWLRLPDTPLLSPGQCIAVVYGTVAFLSLLRCSIAPLLATRRMATHARFSLLQSVVGAATTWTLASTTHRLDLVLIGNTLAILCVQTMVALYTRHKLPWRIEPRQLDPRLALAMLRYGVALQVSGLSTFVMYQFDKLLISAVVTPSEVAHYEVASRSAQALGNISNAPLISFAPGLTERHGLGEDPREQLLTMLRMTVLGLGFFLLLPLAVAPIGLFAWVGQIGYHAAGVFVLLELSVISTTLVWPLSLCAQAMGMASAEMRRALGAMLINVPASFLLISAFGKEGAALGTLLACLLANGAFAWWMLRRVDLSWRRLLRTLAPLLVPILAITMTLALLGQGVEPLVISSRWYMAPAAAGLYALGIAVLLFWLWRGSALRPGERNLLASIPARLLPGRFAKR